MKYIQDIARWFCLSLFVIGTVSFAQSRAPLTWADDLQRLKQGTTDAAEVVRIRTQVEQWLKRHPNSGCSLAPAPSEPWTSQQTSDQAVALHRLVEFIVEKDPDHPFHLGIAEVQVTSTASDSSLVTASMDQSTIRLYDAVTAAKALENMPGVSIQ